MLAISKSLNFLTRIIITNVLNNRLLYSSPIIFLFKQFINSGRFKIIVRELIINLLNNYNIYYLKDL